MLTNRFFRIFLVIFMISAGIADKDAAAQTYAERLGWPEGTKAVIFHVDDAGMSHESNMGVIKAIEDGVATSTSIMMPCPWVPELSAYLKKHPQVDAGLHLTLTAECKSIAGGRSRASRRCRGLWIRTAISGTASKTWPPTRPPTRSRRKSAPR